MSTQPSKRSRRPPPRTSQRSAPRRPAPPTRRPPSFVQRYRGALIGGGIGALLLALAVIVVIKFGPSGSGKQQAAGDQPAAASLVAQVTGIPQSVFDSIGAGSAANPPKPISASPLVSNGKPEVLYIGAEYCPFCAAERWALIAALGRFGSFSNLSTTHSSASDVFPSTPSFSFYGSTYTSRYLSLSTVEQTTNQPSGNGYTPLQQLTSAQQSIMSTYDRPPYVSTSGSIPFVDFGGKFILSGATYNPGILANQSWTSIAAQLSHPTSQQAQGIAGSANLLTATLCQITGQQPSNVCASAGVQKAAQRLAKG